MPVGCVRAGRATYWFETGLGGRPEVGLGPIAARQGGIGEKIARLGVPGDCLPAQVEERHRLGMALLVAQEPRAVDQEH